ncbi:MAG: group III truncated hemoglobin [Crocinitomicaceae bacterium]|nr:group III truncated hemoglobin [Crocinitomicaceae bacterium]
MQKEITHIEDIQLLVDDFYKRIREDNLLRQIFDDVIQNRWPEHLAKMYTFWQTVILGDHTYFGAPFPPHAHLPVEKEHFDRWLELFYATLDDFFIGEGVDKAKWQAKRMASIFQEKIAYIKENPMAY